MTDVPFIFIHLGTDFFPDYINIAINQCFKWNNQSSIYCILSNKFKDKIYNTSVKQIYLEELIVTNTHKRFIETSLLDTQFRNGFWRYSTERFFVLEDFCIEYNIPEFFHIENDNMVYFNAKSLISIFRNNINGIASPTLGIGQNSFGIFYCNNINILQQFNIHLVSGDMSLEEMTKGYLFFKEHKHTAVNLPSIPLIYDNMSDSVKNLIAYKIDEFNGIFDPAQYGQWLGGVDPRNQISAPFIFSNSRALIQPNIFNYIIKECPTNKLNRYYIINNEQNIELPIFILHIHSKQLLDFYI